MGLVVGDVADHGALVVLPGHDPDAGLLPAEGVLAVGPDHQPRPDHPPVGQGDACALGVAVDPGDLGRNDMAQPRQLGDAGEECAADHDVVGDPAERADPDILVIVMEEQGRFLIDHADVQDRFGVLRHVRPDPGAFQHPLGAEGQRRRPAVEVLLHLGRRRVAVQADHGYARARQRRRQGEAGQPAAHDNHVGRQVERVGGCFGRNGPHGV